MEEVIPEVLDFPAQADIPRTSSGQYAPTIGFHALLDRVAVVARRAAGEGDPLGVGSRRFNLAAKELGRDWPSAQMVQKRFDGASLRKIIADALRPIEQRELLRRQEREQVPTDTPPELMAHILRACHFALGSAPRPNDYERWASERRRARGRRHVMLDALPHAVTITAKFGTWDQALVAAGLLAKGETLAQATSPRAPVSVVDLLDRFISETGVLPPRRHFEAWCRNQGFPVGRDVKHWQDRVADVRAKRAAVGATTPTTVTPAKACPPLPTAVAAESSSNSYDDEALLACLHHYRDTYLTDGRRPRRGHYAACAKADPALCSPTTLDKRLGGWLAACRKAGI